MGVVTNGVMTMRSTGAAAVASAAIAEPRLRIVVVHNYYQVGGGEDSVVESECALLEAYGHEVSLFQVSNHSIDTLAGKVRTFTDITYSARSMMALSRTLETFRPHVVHVHNTFPLLTVSVFDACARLVIPVVQTLHNYRVTCANPNLLREGKVCTQCLDGRIYRAVVHRCYRKSWLGSLAVARMIDYNRRHRVWHRKVDRFIALTQSAKDIYVAAGLPADRIVIKPNFAADPGPPHGGARHGALYAGRLSEEKGVRELIGAWHSVPHSLRVAGDGPLAAELRQSAPANVTFLGR